MTFFKFFTTSFLVLATAGLLSACDGRKGPATEDEGLYGGEDVTYTPESTFRVESIDLSETSVQKLDHFGLPESKIFQFAACVTDTVNRGPIVLTRFAVSDGKQERIIRTNTDGCLKWEEIHKISSLQKERLLRFRRHVRGIQGFQGHVVLELALNPWEDSPKLYDLRKFVPPDVENGVDNFGFESDMLNLGFGPANSQGNAEAFLADVSMEFTGHDKSQTQITRLLTLKPAQKFRLRLEPKFVRRNLKNELVRMDLKGGEFKLKLVIVRDGSQDDPQPQDLVADYQGTIKVLYDGTATQDILLRIHDTSKILSRNRAIIVLEPLGEAARVARVGVYGGFIGSLKGQDADVRLMSAEDQSALLAAKIERLLSEISENPRPIDVFRQTAQLAERQDLLGELSQGANYGDRTGRALCELVYHPEDKVEVKSWFGKVSERPALEECRRDPWRYMAHGKQYFVEEILGSPRNVPEFTSVTPRNISVSRSLTWRKESSTSRGGRVSFGFDPLGMLADFIGIKIGIGSEIYASAELSQSNSRGIDASVSETQSFSVVRDAYEITAAVRECEVLYGRIEGRGAFACDENVTEMSFVERYYLVNYNVESSPFADEAADNQWRLTIRGEKKYQEFEKLLTSENSLLSLVKLNPLPDMESNLIPDFRINQVYPGVLSAPAEASPR